MFSHAFILGFLDFVVPNLFLSSFCYLIWYWLSVRYEQSVRFQEEDHDGCWRMYLPRCCSPGSAFVLRPLIYRSSIKEYIMSGEVNENQYVSYPMFKGLQKPLEFMGFQGRYITWAACAVGGAILGFIIAYCILGFVVGLVVLAVSLCSGAALIFFKQKKGLHTKKEEHGVFIYACSHRM